MVACVALAGIPAGAPAADKEGSAAANNAFALDLYARLNDRPGNLFFSPYSISTALAMTYAGAKGETAAQMEKALHFGPGQQVHGSLTALQKQLNAAGQKKGMELNIANGLWAQEAHPFLPAFLDLAQVQYEAKIEQADFQTNGEKVRNEINRWVEGKTHNRIKDLLPAGSVNQMTRLVLANAIYFKGIWARQFKKSETTTQTFHVAPNKTKGTPLMHHFDEVKYAQNDQLQAVELPYLGGDLAMLVLLPRDQNGLGKLEQGLSTESISGLVGQMRRQRVEIFLPRFKVETGVPLKGTLVEMGMGKAFSQDSDFSGMDGTRNLYISEVFHKAWGQVDEEGTEAAAATGVVVATRAAPVVATPPVFRADHPFIFMIRDTRSGAWLFLGRLSEPRE